MSYKYLYDLECPDHLRRVLVELDTILDTAIGQELSYELIDSIEKDVKERLAVVEKKLYDQLVQSCAGVALTGTKVLTIERKKRLA